MNDQPDDDLTLYVNPGCVYCDTVHTAVDRLGIEIGERDVRRDDDARRELLEATGRRRVPVLRIGEGSTARWMPESADIVAYLYERFGEGRRPPLSARRGVDRALQITMWALLVAGGIAGAGDARTGLWTAACATAGLRSAAMAARTRRWQHAAIATVFLLGAVAMPLQAAGVAISEWWPLAAIVVGIVVLASTLRRTTNGDRG